MKKLFFAFALLTHFSATAQTKNAVESKNAIYLTFAGEGMLSAHYNRVLFAKNKFFVDGKIGAGLVASPSILGSEGEIGTILSHSFSANFGVRHCIEVGVGGVFAYVSDENGAFGYEPYPIIGYKFRSASSRFTFRFTVHPYLTPAPHDFNYPVPVGASFGFAF